MLDQIEDNRLRTTDWAQSWPVSTESIQLQKLTMEAEAEVEATRLRHELKKCKDLNDMLVHEAEGKLKCH